MIPEDDLRSFSIGFPGSSQARASSWLRLFYPREVPDARKRKKDRRRGGGPL